MGYTLNFVVLFSLILALGMLVDNAIVIVENIYRHASEGKDIKTAALDGTTEVGWAVVASTFTTIGAFLPMAFWPGVIGKFMGYLPVTVIITLLSSLFVALVINPAVASVFLKVKGAEKTSEYAVPNNKIYRAYRGTLTWSLAHRWIVVFLAIGSLVGSIALFAVTSKGVEFFPMTTPELFTIKIEAADGTRIDATDAIVRRVADPLDGALDADYGFTAEEKADLERRLAEGSRLIEAWIEDTGVGGGQGFAAGGQAPHYAKISVDLLPAEDQVGSPDDFMEALRQVYARIPGANVVLEKQSNGPPAGKPVNIEIAGDDLNVMAELAQKLKSKIRAVPGVIDLDDDIELSRPEVVVRVDRARAALAKLSTSSIALTVRTAINGTKASVYRDGDDEFDITVRLAEADRDSVEALRALTVPNRDGDHIPIVEVAQVRVEPGTGSIRHKDRDRVVSVSANAAPGVLPANLLADVRERVSDIKPPPGYAIRYTGENEDQEAAAAFLGKAMLIALFIIALLLVTQFNSVVQPFIILTSVLLSIIGVLWSLIITQEPFGVIMTGIAVISLAGVVVNNSIVLIDYANQLRSRGMERREAIVTAGLVRFRPVLLTAATTILGFVPLIVGIAVDFVNQEIVVGGRSVEMWGPMARAVGAGLAVATVLTLVMVPVLYSLFDDLADFGDRLRAKFAKGATALLIFGSRSWSPRPSRWRRSPRLTRCRALTRSRPRPQSAPNARRRARSRARARSADRRRPSRGRRLSHARERRGRGVRRGRRRLRRDRSRRRRGALAR